MTSGVIIKIKGEQAQRLSDLALHKLDLEFAKQSLESINIDYPNCDFIQQALWRSAITHYIKCFSEQKSRFRLRYKKIYSDELPRQLFSFFEALRNKHVIHDENAYGQGFPGAILNKEDSPSKIAKIINLSILAQTLSQENYSNLKLLIEEALIWVITQYDTLCNKLTEEYEKLAYNELLALETLDFTLPFNDPVSEPRKKIQV